VSYYLAPSLVAARAEANRIAPRRGKASDGWIGDPAHAARNSDHNPGARNLVHALDLTHDPPGGFDAHAHAERLRVAQDRRVKYLISRGRIAGPGASGGGWHWRRYTGPNPHDRHVHISIHSTVAAETDTRPWWPVVDTPFPAPGFRRTNQFEVTVPINTYDVPITTDKNGCGWHKIAVPRDRIIGYTAPGIRPEADGRYVTAEVGFAAEDNGTIISVTEWEPHATAVVGISVVN
jgi:hypothetical protein